MAISSCPEGGPGGGASLAWAWMDVMELAGRLAQQHAHELKEVLRLPGDRANQARTQLQALAQALNHILITSSSSTGDDEKEGTGSDGAMALSGACACTMKDHGRIEVCSSRGFPHTCDCFLTSFVGGQQRFVKTAQGELAKLRPRRALRHVRRAAHVAGAARACSFWGGKKRP
jgi:hypothetical protein